jgi:hypothetical protein
MAAEFNPDPASPAPSTVIKSAFLWGRSAWNPMQIRVETGLLAAKRLQICTTQNNASDPRFNVNNPNLEVEICFSVTGRRHRFAGQRVDQDPNAAEWKLTIRNWNWGTDSTSRLAIKTSFDSAYASTGDVEAESTFDPSDAQARLSAQGQTGLKLAGNAEGVGLIAWDNSADIAGGSCASAITETAINRGVIKSGEWSTDSGDLTNDDGTSDLRGATISRTARVVYYSFMADCQYNTLTWGPTIGVETAELAAGSTLVSSIGLILAAIAVALRA